MDATTNDALIAVIGTIFGGAGLEVVKRMLAKSKEKEDSATSLRNELRSELTVLKSEMVAVEKELDLWRQKYYELFEKYVFIKVQYDNAMKKLEQSGIILPDADIPNTPLDKEPTSPIELEKSREPDTTA